jgi:tRNA A-37 threonylcarbamoyl transferase component Bud32
MAWVEILPPFESLFRRCGMESAASFLGWNGILVNHHRHRQVEQVVLSEPYQPGAQATGQTEHETSSLALRAGRFFLKKEHAVSWRDRFHNAWAGFGWCSTAVREGAMLQALRRAGMPCPEVVALGEDGKHAFVLLREEAGLTDLRNVLQEMRSASERSRLAVALGRELARLHDAGFDHPDLFAKHILAGPRAESFRFCILDWQRSRRRRHVSWHLRSRDLAVLDATLLDVLASDRLRLRCLRAYWQAARQADKPPLGRLARQIRSAAERLCGRRRIRDVGQAPTPAGDQAFVPLRDRNLLVVRSFAERLSVRWPDAWMEMTENTAHVWDLLSAFACAAGSETVWLHSWPDAALDGPIPRLAHTLFRLQRFGVPAPRLLAVGGSGTHTHLLAESAKTVPFAEAFAKAPFAERCRWLQDAGAIVRRIHEAGYHLPPGDSWQRRLGVADPTGAVMLVNVESLPRGNVLWQQLAPVEFSQSDLRLTRTEQLRFLRGYLKKSHERNWLKAILLSRMRAAEREAAA